MIFDEARPGRRPGAPWPSRPRWHRRPATAAEPADAAGAAGTTLSLSARKVYEQARSQLVQIRTVLKGRASQTSVGSGFFVTPKATSSPISTSSARRRSSPERHDLVYVTADGRGRRSPSWPSTCATTSRCSRRETPARAASTLALRPAGRALAQGERIYSLGNPLDVGFAVMEGNYNGLVKRSFYLNLLRRRARSGGMSGGGPALDQDGQVIGVNVARRVDGEQVSFLVPSAFVAALLSRANDGAPLKTPAHAEVAAQLQAHQAELTERFIAQGWKPDTTCATACRCRRTASCAAGAAAKSRAPAGSTWSAPTA